MKRNEVGEKILIELYNLFLTTEVIFSRDSLWKKMQKLGGLSCSRQIFMRSFSSLQRSGFWYISKNGKYELTEKGVARFEQIRFKESVKRKKWDGSWRLVVFDIPEEKRVARDALRRKLKIFGFYPLQKSVFVFPFDCQKEILNLADFFEANENIEYIMAKTLGRKEGEIRAYFNL